MALTLSPMQEFNSVCKMYPSPARTANKTLLAKSMYDHWKRNTTLEKPLWGSDDGSIVNTLAWWAARLHAGFGVSITPPSKQEIIDIYNLKVHHASGFIRDNAAMVWKSFLLTWPPLSTYTLSLIGSNSKDMNITLDALLACPPKKTAIVGGMLGQCAGDAVGFLVEGEGRTACAKYADGFPSIPANLTRCDFTFGQYSDDSQLAREALITIKQAKWLDPNLYALRMALLFQPDAFRIVGYGYTTAKACIAIRNGTPITASGSPTSSGNGSVMRSAPIGWFHAVDDIPAKATVCGAITHASSDCVNGSIIMALAARHAATTTSAPFNAPHFVKTILKNTPADSCFATHIPELLNMLQEDTTDSLVADKCIEWGLARGEQDWGGNVGCGVVQSLCYALYCYMKYPGDFVSCIGLAIRGGGDVDTTAAMAGALCGSRVGIEGIPRNWVDNLNDCGEWKTTDLIQLVNDAHLAVQA